MFKNTQVKRIIRSGLIGFMRNRAVSFAAIVMLTITLFSIGTAILIRATLSHTLEELKDKVDVNVYFVASAPEDKILELKKSLEKLPEIKEVFYSPKDLVLANFRERHQDNYTTVQALEELGENPFGAALTIKAGDVDQYEGIVRYIKEENILIRDNPGILDSINYFDNKKVIERLSSLIETANKITALIIGVLVLVSVVITYNTIRLATYMFRDEIGVMRLVGASNRYIRGPFVVEAVIYGVIASFISMVVFWGITFWFGSVATEFFGGFNLFYYYLTHFPLIGLALLFSGIGMGVVSSYLATRKYLSL